MHANSDDGILKETLKEIQKAIAQKRRFEDTKLRLAMSKAYNEEHSKNKQKIKDLVE